MGKQEIKKDYPWDLPRATHQANGRVETSPHALSTKQGCLLTMLISKAFMPRAKYARFPRPSTSLKQTLGGSLVLKISLTIEESFYTITILAAAPTGADSHLDPRYV